MPNQLKEPLLDNGILNTYFFNGRVLDADALKTDQKANRLQHGQLGRAIGEGIAWGLEVTVESAGSLNTPGVVKIREGLAINRRGQTLELALSGTDPSACVSSGGAGATDTISLALAETVASPIPTTDLFMLCQIADPTVATLAGVFLLVMSPASGFRGSAPMKSLSVNGKDTGCGSRYAVEGVTFRLIGFPSEGAALGDVTTLQNRLAHRCYGTEEQIQGLNGQLSFAQDPFDFTADYGALDILRDNGALTDCDVPLALIYQTSAGIQFCDMWAARRPLVPPSASDLWPLHAGKRRVAEGTAMFLQFQEQLDALYQTDPNRSLLKAKDHFRYLPPAGYLRIKKNEFDKDLFFTGLTTQRFTLDPAYLRLMIESSYHLDAIDVAAAKPPQIALYESADADGYLLFMRADASIPIVIGPPPGGGKPDAGTGSIDVFAALSDLEFFLPGKMGKIFTVTAKDENGIVYPAEFIPSPQFLHLGLGSKGPFYTHYAFRKLPTGTYLVTISALNYTSVKRQVTLADGDLQTINVSLLPFSSPPGKGKKPGGIFNGEWLDNQWYKDAAVLDPKIDWKKREDLLKWKNQPDPPPDVQQKFQEWANWLQQENPDAPIDSTNTRVLVDPTYTPDQVASDYYAYLQFGENGAYVPLLLTAKDKSLDRSVSLSKGNLVGVDAEMVSQLAGAGVDDLSLLAASPKTLVAEALGLSADAGQGLINAGRGAVATLKNSVLQFNGVTEETRGALAELNITDAVTLANADVATLTQKVGDAAFAARLVEEARGAVSPEHWALDASALGLTGAEVEGLHQQGVVTQGQVAARKAAGTGAALGLPAAQLDKVVEAFHSSSNNLRIEQTAHAPVASLGTVDSQSALILAAAGLNDVGKLALADIGTVAAHLGGRAELAGRIIAEAKGLQQHAGGAG